MVRSGCSASARKMPGRPERGFLGLSARLAFSLLDGGNEELSGVLGGLPSLASSKPGFESGNPFGQPLELGGLGQHQRDQVMIRSSLHSRSSASRFIRFLNRL